MSKNCLVTRLLSSVADDSLPKLGVLKVRVPAKEGEFYLYANAPDGECAYKLYRKSDNVLIDEGKVWAEGYNVVLANTPESYLEISNKYALTKFDSRNLTGVGVVSFKEFQYCKNLLELRFPSYVSEANDVDNNIAHLADIPSLISGTFVGLHKLTGNIEEYCTRALANGKTTPITLSVYDSDPKLNNKFLYQLGALASQPMYIEFGVNSCTIKVGDASGATRATYSNGVWTYA